MNPSGPNPQMAMLQQQMVQMQQLMQSLQSASGAPPPPPSSSLSAPTLGTLPGNLMLQHVPGLNGTLPSLPQASSSAGPITAYQSPRGSYHGLSAASQGHPSAPAQVSQSSTTQPFLGLDNLAVDLSRQVNQARLASSASSQPRQAQMAIRGRRRTTTRGPAVNPPRLAGNARRPDVRHCVTEIFPQDGGPAQNALMMTIKVYPPSVCIPPLRCWYSC